MPHPEEIRSLIAEDQRLLVQKLQAAHELREDLHHNAGLTSPLLDRLELHELAEISLALAEARRSAPPVPLPLHPGDLALLETVLGSSRASAPMMDQAAEIIEAIRPLVPGSLVLSPPVDSTQYHPPPPANRSSRLAS